MADSQSNECASASSVSTESFESTVELNIKTLDSQIHSFHVDKNMPVSAFKETISGKVGVPVGQQRLIFRGKVLKDNHLLSEYHVENGDTLHLVARQTSETQPSSGGEGTQSSNPAGQDAGSAGSRPRVGQGPHGILLGTFGVGDPTDGGVSDISRVIGAVLSSIGVGNPSTMGGSVGLQPNMQFNIPVNAPQGNQTEGSQDNVGNQSQAGNQTNPRQAPPSQSLPNFLRSPIGAAIPMPTLSTPIPDSLNTLSEFMNRMEIALAQIGGNQSNQPPSNTDRLPSVELPSNARGVPTPAALAIVLRHAQRLLSGPTIASLSHVAGHLEQEENSNDLTVRTQVQTDSMQAGLAMQHLGSLLLELGRTLLSLRIGQTTAESYVNAGPAVYISPSGPNPLMVQPFPLQTTSLFGGQATPSPNPGTFGPVGVGAVPRHVNIHIHTGMGPRTANGQANQGERANANGISVQMRNVTMTAVPPGPAAVSVPNSGQPDSSTSQNQSTGSDVVNEDSGNLPKNQGDDKKEGPMDAGGDMSTNKDSSFTADRSESSPAGENVMKSADEVGQHASTSTDAVGSSGSNAAVPLGLGMGGLQPKRRIRQQRSQARTTVGTSNASTSVGSNASTSVGVDGRADTANVLSQVMQSPALEGLLSGVSQQTGIDSPDLRNMLGQLTQNPMMMNTVNQLAQQIDSQGLGSMFAGLGGPESGGVDMSRMFRQMMPLVSQALGGGSSNLLQQRSSSNLLQQGLPAAVGPSVRPSGQYSQINLQDATMRIERQDPPEQIFSSVIGSAAQYYDNGSATGALADSLSSEGGLASEFMEMLSRDVSRRLQNESGDC